MRFLITSDLHLTDKPEHRYRLQYLDWLTSLTNKLQPNHVAILGDLTDQKDRHSGWLVNAICARLSVLARAASLDILFGNHDGPSRDLPYWAFLNSFEGIAYFTEEAIAGKVVYCPWGCEKDAIDLVKKWDSDLLLMHATVSGAISENGQRLEGSCPASFLEEGSHCKVFSGDVHVPQVIGDVEYVGAPYHVHFGDSFVPRTVLYDTTTRKTAEFHYPSPALVVWRTTFDDPTPPPEGCRARIIVTSEHEVMPDDWRALVAQLRAQEGCEIVSCSLERVKAKRVRRAPNARRSDEAVVRTYGSRQKFDESTIATGVELVKEKQ